MLKATFFSTIFSFRGCFFVKTLDFIVSIKLCSLLQFSKFVGKTMGMPAYIGCFMEFLTEILLGDFIRAIVTFKNLTGARTGHELKNVRTLLKSGKVEELKRSYKQYNS